ncbi:hypothetical protein [Candidatus Berkiella aquae]|uniref:Uncharacterized protein n=1 Tax=Candidatus Berkiella aquae TaxID=295108 RepID=A0A0Q9YLF6_9GAMM|nr:hypothetical protein [Candidatus Berkiella aquae]MCS5711511.1 hypothetical protein [Candidatus Berkiella aquae]
MSVNGPSDEISIDIINIAIESKIEELYKRLDEAKKLTSLQTDLSSEFNQSHINQFHEICLQAGELIKIIRELDPTIKLDEIFHRIETQLDGEIMLIIFYHYLDLAYSSIFERHVPETPQTLELLETETETAPSFSAECFFSTTYHNVTNTLSRFSFSSSSSSSPSLEKESPLAKYRGIV